MSDFEDLIAVRQEKAYLLYRSGLTMTTIAKSLGVSQQTISEDIKKCVNQIQETIQLTSKQMRLLQLDRLQYLEERLATQIQQGDCKAIKVALDINLAKSKLLGLENPDEAIAIGSTFPIELPPISSSGNADVEEALSSAGETVPKSNKIVKKSPSQMSDEELKNYYFTMLQQSD